MRDYNISPQTYQKNQDLKAVQRCNGFTVINTGTTTCFVNQTRVIAGNFMSVGGNENEQYIGRIIIKFASQTDPGNEVTVIQKFFTDGKLYDDFGK